MLTIYHSFTNLSQPEIEAKFTGKGYNDPKKELAEVVIEGLRPIQERYDELTAEPGRIDSILKAGADKAHPIAEKTLAKVKEKVGLG